MLVWRVAGVVQEIVVIARVEDATLDGHDVQDGQETLVSNPSGLGLFVAAVDVQLP